MKLMITGCARCQQDHEVEFKKFQNPISDGGKPPWIWNYWGTCPNTGDPVLMRIEEIEDRGLKENGRD